MKFEMPMTGEEREVYIFPMVPTEINGTVYWFEKIKVHQSYNTRKLGWNNDWVCD